MAVHDSYSLDLNPDKGRSTASDEQRQVFGSYQLFKLLKRDSLGEVYRAGQLGASAIERVVSLRIFKSGDIEAERFWNTCQRRKDLGDVLSGGPFGEVVEIGFEAGAPYVAHDYVFGRSLAELLVQARETSEPIPFEQSLLIMERISSALRNAYQTRIDEQRITHGFLTPQFVHLSNEGELRLTGFETGEALQAVAGSPGQSGLAGYLSPEVNQKLPAKACDDVYSLAAIFMELLTGEPTPELNPAEASRWIEAAMVQDEGTPLPEDVRHLIRESLLPRDQRISNPDKWHKALVDVITASGESLTTFNLAFFMHTLFGDELDREAEVVAAERQAGMPEPAAPVAVETPAAAPVEAPAPTPAPVVPEPIQEPAVSPTAEVAKTAAAPAATPEPLAAKAAPTLEAKPAAPVEAELPSKNDSLTSPEFDEVPQGLEESPDEPVPIPRAGSMSASGADGSHRWIGIAIAAVLVAGGSVAFFVMDPLADDVATIEVAAAPRPDEGLPGSPDFGGSAEMIAGVDAVAPPLSPAELEEQVRILVTQRAGDMEKGLKEEYDKRLLKLRALLEQARKAEAESAVAAQAPTQVTEEPATTQQKPTETNAAAPSPLQLPNEGAAPKGSTAEPQDQVADAGVARPQSPPADAIQPPAIELAPPIVPPQPKPEPAEPEVAEPEPVEAGSIVPLGTGVTAPTLIRQPNVVYPTAAVRLKRQATVKVRILVDEEGKPTQITLVGDKIGLGFEQAARQAARTTRWTPPTKSGVPVKVWVDLSINFKL